VQVADGEAGRTPLRRAGERRVPDEIARPPVETHDRSLPVECEHFRQTVPRDIGDRGRYGDGVAHLVPPDLLTVGVNRDDEPGRGANDEVGTAVSVHVADGG
jgi:hypothetical protein